VEGTLSLKWISNRPFTALFFQRTIGYRSIDGMAYERYFYRRVTLSKIWNVLYLLEERNLEYLNLIPVSINIYHINNSMDIKYVNAHGKKKRERER